MQTIYLNGQLWRCCSSFVERGHFVDGTTKIHFHSPIVFIAETFTSQFAIVWGNLFPGEAVCWQHLADDSIRRRLARWRWKYAGIGARDVSSQKMNPL